MKLINETYKSGEPILVNDTWKHKIKIETKIMEMKHRQIRELFIFLRRGLIQSHERRNPMKLENYEGKKVKIIDTKGKKWIGIVDMYNPPDDFGEGESESIDIKVDEIKECLFEFDVSSIRSIEILQDFKALYFCSGLLLLVGALEKILMENL